MIWNWRSLSLKSWHFEASEDIMTKFKSQALHIIRIQYWNAGGSGNPPSFIPTLWNIGILTIKRPPGPNNMMASVTLKWRIQFYWISWILLQQPHLKTTVICVWEFETSLIRVRHSIYASSVKNRTFCGIWKYIQQSVICQGKRKTSFMNGPYFLLLPLIGGKCLLGVYWWKNAHSWYQKGTFFLFHTTMPIRVGN